MNELQRELFFYGCFILMFIGQILIYRGNRKKKKRNMENDCGDR